MEKQQYKKLSIDYPIEEYIFLKLACTKQGISLREFVTNAVMKSVDEYEAQLDSISLREALTDEEIKNAISWKEAEKRLGWDKL